MKVYIVSEYVDGWGITTKAFTTMEKAQAYVRQYIGTELVVLLSGKMEGIHSFIDELEINTDTKDSELITSVWFGENDYIEVDEIEVE